MSKLKFYCILIFIICTNIVYGIDTFGSWALLESNETPQRIKAYSKSINNESVHMSLVCAKETDPTNSFLLLLNQEKPFETMEKSDVRMKALIDDSNPINVEWSYQKDILLMFDSQWLVQKLVKGKELNLKFRDINGKTELEFSLDGFGEAVEKMESLCGYKFSKNE